MKSTKMKMNALGLTLLAVSGLVSQTSLAGNGAPAPELAPNCVVQENTRKGPYKETVYTVQLKRTDTDFGYTYVAPIKMKAVAELHLNRMGDESVAIGKGIWAVSVFSKDFRSVSSASGTSNLSTTVNLERHHLQITLNCSDTAQEE